MNRLTAPLAALLLASASMAAAEPARPVFVTEIRTGEGSAGPLFRPWIDATSPDEPQVQVQSLDPDTFVIRQSIRTNFEGPFLYLLFGRDKAVLFDTGAGGLKIRPAIDRIIGDWRAAHHREAVHLVVAHSHGHGDHHQGDDEFRDRPDTTVVGLAAEDVADAFDIDGWPAEIGHLELGGRRLDLIPTPGHERAALMVYDPRTRTLFTGDALYPGRLYFPVNHFIEYREGIDRVVAFTRGRPVDRLLGTHIEMTATPGQDFADEAPSHPKERGLELPYADLLELKAALHAMGDTPRREVHPDFIITPIPPRP